MEWLVLAFIPLVFRNTKVCLRLPPWVQVEDERNKPTSFSHIKFTNDGKLMLAVCEGKIYLVDAFDGVVKHRLQTGLPEGSPAIEACFSTDGQYVLSGTSLPTRSLICGMDLSKEFCPRKSSRQY